MENNENINESENSILNKIKKEGGFKIPAEYFDTFQKDIQIKIEENKSAFFQLSGYRIPILSASFTLLSIVFLFNYNEPTELASNDCSDQEIISYFNEHFDEYNDAEIIEEISFLELSEFQMEVEDSTRKESENRKDIIEELTEEEIMEYLLDDGYGDGDWDEL